MVFLFPLESKKEGLKIYTFFLPSRSKQPRRRAERAERAFGAKDNAFLDQVEQKMKAGPRGKVS